MQGRIRSIKPEVHTDDELWDLEQETGFPIFRAFTGLWNYADREGRFKWRPRQLKAVILPYWEGDFSRVMDALVTRGFLVKYRVTGRDYGLVRTFKDHQQINGREAPSVLPGPDDDASSTREPRVTARVTDAIRTEQNRTEQNRTEGNARGSRGPRSRAGDFLALWERLGGIAPGTINGADLHTASRILDKAGGDFDVASGWLESWLADEWVRSKRPKLGHLEENMQKYAVVGDGSGGRRQDPRSAALTALLEASQEAFEGNRFEEHARLQAEAEALQVEIYGKGRSDA